MLVVDGKVVTAQLERHLFLFALFQEYLLESFQADRRSGDGADLVIDIELYHFLTVAIAAENCSRGSSVRGQCSASAGVSAVPVPPLA